jgi:hypothetical protein
MSRVFVSPDQAIEEMQEADVLWTAALGGLASYPSRLRSLAEAAEAQRRAFTVADLAKVEWTPRPGARALKFPFEAQAASGRPGPTATWKQFDTAVEQLGLALEGSSMKRLADAFDRISSLATELADAVEAEQPGEGRRKTG